MSGLYGGLVSPVERNPPQYTPQGADPMSWPTAPRLTEDVLHKHTIKVQDTEPCVTKADRIRLWITEVETAMLAQLPQRSATPSRQSVSPLHSPEVWRKNSAGRESRQLNSSGTSRQPSGVSTGLSANSHVMPVPAPPPRLRSNLSSASLPRAPVISRQGSVDKLVAGLSVLRVEGAHLEPASSMVRSSTTLHVIPRQHTFKVSYYGDKRVPAWAEKPSVGPLKKPGIRTQSDGDLARLPPTAQPPPTPERGPVRAWKSQDTITLRLPSNASNIQREARRLNYESDRFFQNTAQKAPRPFRNHRVHPELAAVS